MSSGDILHSPHVCFPIFFKIQLLLFYFEIVHVARNFRVSFFFNLNINQIDALNFVMSLFHASTCFEHYVLIVRRSKLYYTASGIITPIGGLPVHRLREDISHSSARDGHLVGVMIPEAV